MTNSPKEPWEIDFDQKFTVRSEGVYYFDIEDRRTENYIHSHKPTPKEIKSFISSVIESVKKEEQERIIEIIKSTHPPKEEKNILTDYVLGSNPEIDIKINSGEMTMIYNSPTLTFHQE